MTDWSKRKRLEATISAEPADRPPVALWRHWPGDDQSAEELAASHLKWQQDYDWDLVKVSPASSFSVVDWGVEDRWVGSLEGTREYTHQPIKQPYDWEALQPLEPTQGMLATQIKALRLVSEGLDAGIPYIATIFNPLSQARHLANNEIMLNHMRSHPDSFHNGLETITETTLRYIEAARATGISGIFMAVQHARYPMMSREEYLVFGRPYDEQILAAVQDLWLNMLHIHSTEIMFDVVGDYPVQYVNWHDRETDVSLADGLKHIMGAASGGVSRWSMHQETPTEALSEVHHALAQTNGRRLMLGTGCVIMATTPLRNIRALREVANSYQ
jgi:uroporphyrinogen decarboxylase